MEDWQYVKIGDVCMVERGGSPRPIDKYITDDENGVNWIKIGDTTDSMYITSTAQKIIPAGMKKSRYVEAGDFLLSNSMSFGRPYILKIDGCIHDGWLVLRDKDDLFDKRFLYYYLSAPSTYQKFKNLAVGGVVNNLNSEMVRKVEIPLPDKIIQEQIADVLDKVSELIDERKQQLEKLDELIKARFVELFGDPVLNPKGFVEGSVSEYCKMTQGTQIPMSEQINEYQQGYYRYLYIRDLKYNDSDWIYVQDKYDDKKLTEKDLVVVNTGNTAGEIYYGKDGILSNNLFKVSFDADVLNTTYMFAYFSSQQFQSMLWSKMKEGTQPHLGHKIFGSKKLIIPPMDLQNQFAAFVEQTDKSKLEVQKSLDKLEVLKKVLMQQYFG